MVKIGWGNSKHTGTEVDANSEGNSWNKSRSDLQTPGNITNLVNSKIRTEA